MIRKLSPSTNVMDCGPIIKAYLQSVGHRASVIGVTDVYVVKGGNGKPGVHTVAAFGSLAEAEAFVAEKVAK